MSTKRKDIKTDVADKEGPTDLSNAIVSLTDHAHKEISWVRSAYKFVVVIIGALIAIGIYFSYKSASEFKADLRDEGLRVQARQKSEFELLGQKLRQDLQSDVNDLRKEVTKRIDSEFATKEISALVQDKAKERIDTIADTLIQKNITNQIAPIRNEFVDLLSKSKADIQDRVEKLDENSKQTQKTGDELQVTLAEARSLLEKLDEQSMFIMAVLAAQTEDRDAYQRLDKWAGDENFRLRSEARKAKFAIQLSYANDMFDKPYKVLNWRETAKPNLFGMDEIGKNWQNVPSDLARAYVEFVWGHTNIDKEQKLSFLHGVLADSRNNLPALHRAARLLSDELKADYNPPLEFAKIEKSWSERLKTNQISASTNKPAK